MALLLGLKCLGESTGSLPKNFNDKLSDVVLHLSTNCNLPAECVQEVPPVPHIDSDFFVRFT
jgi:hypothetical protein